MTSAHDSTPSDDVIPLARLTVSAPEQSSPTLQEEIAALQMENALYLRDINRLHRERDRRLGPNEAEWRKRPM